MTTPKVDLKSPWLAALLAFLVPGAGHMYQGRWFKGVLYSVCILGLFFTGMALGDWQAVYYQRQPQNTTYGYFSQVLVGLPALPAYFQSKRYNSAGNLDSGAVLNKPLSASFSGVWSRNNPQGETESSEIDGQIELTTVTGHFGPEIKGVFRGTLEGDQSIELKLGESFELAPKIGAGSRRRLICSVLEDQEGQQFAYNEIDGSIPRGFWDRFEAPLDKHDLDEVNGRLGKLYEIALVYTWIAGLLNLLAIWDALEGPAYAYGYEDQQAERDADQKDTDTANANTADEQQAQPAEQQV